MQNMEPPLGIEPSSPDYKSGASPKMLWRHNNSLVLRNTIAAVFEWHTLLARVSRLKGTPHVRYDLNDSVKR